MRFAPGRSAYRRLDNLPNLDPMGRTALPVVRLRTLTLKDRRTYAHFFLQLNFCLAKRSEKNKNVLISYDNAEYEW